MGVPRRYRSIDGLHTRRVTFRASDAEVAELGRRARAVGVSVARYVATAALERDETVSERRMWAAEVCRAERIVRGVADGIEALLVAQGAGGQGPEGITEVLVAVREAAEAVVAMGRAASQPGS